MSPAWLILIVSLPTRNAAGRMRVWRALKAMGSGVLRDGVYLLPNRPGFRRALQDHAEDVLAGGGHAQVLALNSEDPAQQALFEGLFDRSADYAKLIETIRQTADWELGSEEPARLRKQLDRLRKDFEALVAVDFFPGEAREQAAMALEDLEHAVAEVLTPDEPHAVHKRIGCLHSQDYQGRSWATRQRPWVDRLASAWLIRRFIDPEARFLWLASPVDCPGDALGFDFDGATFTHVGAKVTFEVLLASFGLAKDGALQRLGALVHYLDVGGIPVPEAAGLESLLRGMRQRLADDDALLAQAGQVFDALYLDFSGTES